MKISFLVTYYNQKQYVDQSLQSILNIRKPCQWEILVGDDGSTDGTIELVQDYIRRYPGRIFLHIMPRKPGEQYAPVQRASANRMNLLEKSTGDAYCILDGDDYYCDESFLEEALEVFRTRKEISAVVFGYRLVTDGIPGEDRILPPHMDGTVADKREYLRSRYIHAGACVFRHNVSTERIAQLKRIGYYDDNDILIEALDRGELYGIRRVIYAYRQTSTSTFNSMSFVEQAVLNVQGYDVDVQLISPEYHEDLLYRNGDPIVTMYIWRRQLRKLLGESKYERYHTGCKQLEASLAKDLLEYERLDKDRAWQAATVVRSAMRMLKKRTVKRYLQYIAYRLKG